MLDPEKISGTQLTLLVIGLCLDAAVMYPPAQMAGTDAWIAVAIGYSLASLLGLIFVKLSTLFRGMTFVEICIDVYGPLLGKIISGLFLFYLIHAASIVIFEFISFFSSVMFINTPVTVLTGMLLLVCLSAVRNGIEVIARCASILVPSMLLLVVVTIVLLSMEMNLDNLLPFFEDGINRVLVGAHQAVFFPFGETVVFLMVFPALNKVGESKMLIKGIVLAGLTLTFSMLRNILVLGRITDLVVYPSYLAVRQMHIAEVLTRMEVIVVLNFMAMGFIELAILLYGASLGTAQLFRLKTYLPVVLPIGIITGVLSFNGFSTYAEAAKFRDSAALIYRPIFEFLLPATTLVLALIKRKFTPSAKNQTAYLK